MSDLTKLSEGQRDCLRQVLVRKNSKEIAIELGISPHTVDQRLRVAIRALGVTSRFEAARCLAEHEAGDTYQPWLYQASSLAYLDPLPDPLPHTAEGDGIDRSEHEEGTQEGLPKVTLPHPARQAFSLRLPSYRGGRNDLSMWARAGWILAFAIATALAFGTFLTGIKSLADLATGSS